MAYEIRLDWQAEAAINSLSPRERQEVDAALGRLREGGGRDGPQTYHVHGRDGEADVSVLRVGDALRVLFTVDPGGAISVQDVINRNFVRRYG